MPGDHRERSRVRFEGFHRETFPDGRVRIEVELEWKGGTRFRSQAEGTGTLEGETRAAALASLEAAETVTEGRLSLELMGVKAIRAFDGWVVIVSVRGESAAGTYSLIGSTACPDGRTTRGAAVAVLDAINRILEKYMDGE
jgi:hypothetical protein